MTKIYLDAGHGGKDPGACAHGLKEKDLTLSIMLAAKAELESYKDVTIKCSRTVDKDTSINGICNDVNSWGADVAISFHINAGGGDGAEVWVAKSSTKGKSLAQKILNELTALGQKSRGIKTKTNAQGTDYFGFNRMPNCPSIIVESFFIDSDDEQKKIGAAIAKGIANYLGLVKKGEKEPLFTIKAKGNLIARKTESLLSKQTRTLTKGNKYKIWEVNKKGTRGKTTEGDWITITTKYVEKV